MQVGYKELCIHMASDHGGLEEVMAKDERKEIRELVDDSTMFDKHDESSFDWNSCMSNVLSRLNFRCTSLPKMRGT